MMVNVDKCKGSYNIFDIYLVEYVFQIIRKTEIQMF